MGRFFLTVVRETATVHVTALADVLLLPHVHILGLLAGAVGIHHVLEAFSHTLADLGDDVLVKDVPPPLPPVS